MFRRVPILLAILFIASCDSEAPPTAPEAYEPISHVGIPPHNNDLPLFLLLDEDAIAKHNAPNFFTGEDVNDDIADVGLRTQLRFFADNEELTITLHSGVVGDEGWHALTEIPDSWDAADPTVDGLRNYLAFGPFYPTPGTPGPGLGSGDDPEALLDKTPGVTPLRATGLKLLEGHKVCGVVYQADISIGYGPLNGSLKGRNLGTVAFEVLSVRRLAGSSSSLPEVEIEILDAELVCADAGLTLFDDAPVPTSSSEPFDVRPPCTIGGIVIDCDVVRVQSSQGGNASVFRDPGGEGQTLAAIITIDLNDVFADEEHMIPVSEFVLTLLHVETPPSVPSDPGGIPIEDQVPFFIEVTAAPPVFFKDGATLVLCQPADLGDVGSEFFVPDLLHQFLKIFQVTDLGEAGTSTEILDTEVEGNRPSCPGEPHGGLRTSKIGGFSGFGAKLDLPATAPPSGSFVYSRQVSLDPKEIFVNEAGVPRQITEFGGGAPDWLGNLIAFDRDGDIYTIDDVGEAGEPITTAVNLTSSGTVDLGPHWSPDGSRIAFSRDQGGLIFDILVMDADGMNQVNLTNNSANDGSPAWSPDGSLIAFTSNRDGDFDVYVMSSSDGSGVTQLTFDPLDDGSPDWSPDGQKITFSRFDVGDEGAIWIMDKDGLNQEQLTNPPTGAFPNDSLDFNPAWSVDGSQIIFERLPIPSGRGDILRITVADGLTGSGAVDLSADERSPAWQKPGSGFPDLEITSLTISPAAPENVDALTYSVLVTNAGDVATVPFNVEVSLFSGMCGSGGGLIGSSKTHAVGGGFGAAIAFNMRDFGTDFGLEESTLSPGFYCLKAVADPNGAVDAEKDLVDNVNELDFTVIAAPILIYGPSMEPASGFQPKNEEVFAQEEGFTVVVADAVTWGSFTTADFAEFSAIVFGDFFTTPGVLSSLADAELNKATWSAAVTGRMIVSGMNPQTHQCDPSFIGPPPAGRPSCAALNRAEAPTLVKNAITFAATGAGTGLYASLSRYYSNAATNTQVSFLNAIGDFRVVGISGSNANTVTIVAPAHPVMVGLTSGGLSGWGASIHQFVEDRPAPFITLANGGVAGVGVGVLPVIIATPVP